MVLLQARCPCLLNILTVLEDAHVFLLSEDGVVGLQAVLLEHLLIAVGVSDVVSYRLLIVYEVHTRSLFNVIRQCWSRNESGAGPIVPRMSRRGFSRQRSSYWWSDMMQVRWCVVLRGVVVVVVVVDY